MDQRPSVHLSEENTGENLHKLELTKDFQAETKKEGGEGGGRGEEDGENEEERKKSTDQKKNG